MKIRNPIETMKMSGREFYDSMLARGMPLYELVTFIAWARATAVPDPATLH